MMMHPRRLGRQTFLRQLHIPHPRITASRIHSCDVILCTRSVPVRRPSVASIPALISAFIPASIPALIPASIARARHTREPIRNSEYCNNTNQTTPVPQPVPHVGSCRSVAVGAVDPHAAREVSRGGQYPEPGKEKKRVVYQSGCLELNF